jgi:hypothetical protein
MRLTQDPGKGGVGHSASQYQWTSTGKKEVDPNVQFATVFPSYPQKRCVDVHWLWKDPISRSYPDTTPIFFYHRSKPFFESVNTIVAHGFDLHDFIYMQVYELLTSLGRVRWKDLPHCRTPCVRCHAVFPYDKRSSEQSFKL